MKIITLLFSIFFLTSSYAQEFEIIDATAQKWAGGQKQSGHGINYSITLIANKSSQKLNFDKLWIGSNYFDIKAYKHVGVKNVEIYDKGDTVYINARSLSRPAENEDITTESQNPKLEMPPFEFKAAALIGYTCKGKRKYKTVDVIKEAKAVYYP